MELAQPIQPMRAVIRCKAKQLLIADPELRETIACFDEALFQELAITLFRGESYQQLASSCRTKQIAAAIEDRVAIALAVSYKRIKQQQRDPVVQQLNQLLESAK
ncbi:hypothetical protein [Leptolyngbya ohadii]|uniref:hypothetical protein n=1 Tax=Leptolyngbya ohadii TaxID=1962290 RepID=UPI000B59C8FB|nr:hypothetical protein [Leptolyngbya ohadii]